MATLASSVPSAQGAVSKSQNWIEGARWKRIAIATVGVVLIAMIGTAAWRWYAAVNLSTEYQAVLLANGAVYFGKLEGAGSRFPVLREVYYVQSGVDPDTKQPKNILLKRGSEWHAPDRMILNAAQIVLIEPVGPNSRVASLIEGTRAAH